MCVSIFIYPTMLLHGLSRVFFFIRDSSSSFFLSFFSFFSHRFSCGKYKLLLVIVVFLFLLQHISRTGGKGKELKAILSKWKWALIFSSFFFFLSSVSMQQAQITARHCKKKTQFMCNSIIIIIITRSSLSHFFPLSLFIIVTTEDRAAIVVVVEFPCIVPSSSRSLPIQASQSFYLFN